MIRLPSAGNSAHWSGVVGSMVSAEAGSVEGARVPGAGNAFDAGTRGTGMTPGEMRDHGGHGIA